MRKSIPMVVIILAVLSNSHLLEADLMPLPGGIAGNDNLSVPFCLPNLLSSYRLTYAMQINTIYAFEGDWHMATFFQKESLALNYDQGIRDVFPLNIRVDIYGDLIAAYTGRYDLIVAPETSGYAVMSNNAILDVFRESFCSDNQWKDEWKCSLLALQ